VVRWHRAATQGGGTFALAIALSCQRATANALPLYIAAWLCDDDDQCIVSRGGSAVYHTTTTTKTTVIYSALLGHA